MKKTLLLIATIVAFASCGKTTETESTDSTETVVSVDSLEQEVIADTLTSDTAKVDSVK